MTLPHSALAPMGINPSPWLGVQLWRGGQTDWPLENQQMWTHGDIFLPALAQTTYPRAGTWLSWYMATATDQWLPRGPRWEKF